MSSCSVGSCAPGLGARLDAVNDRLTGVNACKQAIQVSPQLVAVDGAISSGGVAGDWQTVRMLFVDSGTHMPAGTKVIGSNGALYKLLGDDNVDPVTDDGTNWVLVSAPAIAAMEAAQKAGAPLGDWAKAKAAYAATNRKIPAGSIVVGSDGGLYRLTGGNPDADPTTDGGVNWTPLAPPTQALDATQKLGGVSGDWAKVLAALTAAGKTMPTGTVVIGSDGAFYRLIGDPSVDPTTDTSGVNWVNLALLMHRYVQLTF